MTKDMQLKTKIDLQSPFLLLSLPLSYTFLCPSLLSCSLSHFLHDRPGLGEQERFYSFGLVAYGL